MKIKRINNIILTVILSSDISAETTLSSIIKMESTQPAAAPLIADTNIEPNTIDFPGETPEKL